MSMQDPIADMLTRIRNAASNKQKQVMIRRNRICSGIAQVLREEGYINGFDQIDDANQGRIRIDLKYGPRGEQVIHALKRISKPSCRVYRKVDELPRVLDGLGTAIVSTSNGIVSDRQARAANVGGELICTVQ